MRFKQTASGRGWLVIGSGSDEAAARERAEHGYSEAPLGYGDTQERAVREALSENALAMLRAAAKPGARVERHALRLQLVDLAPLAVEAGILEPDVLAGLNRPNTDALPARGIALAFWETLNERERDVLTSRLGSSLGDSLMMAGAQPGHVCPSGTAAEPRPSEASQALPPVSENLGLSSRPLTPTSAPTMPARESDALALGFACPTCLAVAGQPCWTTTGLPLSYLHVARYHGGA